MQKSDFIKKFLKPLLSEVPIVIKEEIAEDGTKMIDTTESKEKRVKVFIEKYISTFQTIYDLIPLFSYICDDPYLSKSK